MQALGGNLYSVGNRTHEKALSFAEKYGIAKVYDKPEDIFSDPDVDIVYISTPHNTHIRYLLPALAAGKHVLCEKSITLNSLELDQARRCADEHGVVLAEAMTLYHMPIYKQLADLIRSGALGPLRFIQMNFGSYKEYDMNNRVPGPPGTDRCRRAGRYPLAEPGRGDGDAFLIAPCQAAETGHGRLR